MSGGVLYVVATPIGNLDDLSQRAAQCLREANVVYAEDTRRSRTLLAHVGSVTPLRSLHEHNERERAQEVLGRLAAGEVVALVSDAGTPVVSDPGAWLVARVSEAGFAVSPLPGASALAAAISVAGFTAGPDGVLFVGFLPPKGAARQRALDRVAGHGGVVVLYESPHRVRDLLAQLEERSPGRAACVCRELTKLYEEIVRGPVGELLEWARQDIKGEITVVLDVEQRTAKEVDDARVIEALASCRKAGLSARDSISAVAALLELPRRKVYGLCQKLEE